jgi:hypothetical protein
VELVTFTADMHQTADNTDMGTVDSGMKRSSARTVTQSGCFAMLQQPHGHLLIAEKQPEADCKGVPPTAETALMDAPA